MIITHVPKFHYVFILPQSNLWDGMNQFYLHLAFLSSPTLFWRQVLNLTTPHHVHAYISTQRF